MIKKIKYKKYHEGIAIFCEECEMEFLLYSVLYSEENEVMQLVEQTGSSKHNVYCPYCGKYVHKCSP